MFLLKYNIVTSKVGGLCMLRMLGFIETFSTVAGIH